MSVHRVVALVLGILVCGVTAQIPDSVCLIDDLPVLLGGGSLMDTSGPLASLDSIHIDGGDCDSVAATMYLYGLPVGLPLTVVREDSCTVHVVALGGAMDTTIDACAGAAVRKSPVAAGRTGSVGTLVARHVSANGPLPDGVSAVHVFRVDGQRMRALPGVNRPAPGAYVVRFAYQGRRWTVTFTDQGDR